MCLYDANKIYPLEDITCYKIVTTGRYSKLYSGFLRADDPTVPMVFKSPHMSNKVWKLGKTETLSKRTRPVITSDGSVPGGSYHIHGGSYHSYASLQDAKNAADSYYNTEIAVLECKIPKSSGYVYKGRITRYNLSERDDILSFASQKLKPIRVLYLNSSNW